MKKTHILYIINGFHTMETFGSLTLGYLRFCLAIHLPNNLSLVDNCKKVNRENNKDRFCQM